MQRPCWQPPGSRLYRSRIFPRVLPYVYGAASERRRGCLFRHLRAHPLWMKLMLAARNRLALWGGLDAPKPMGIFNGERKSSYAVGDVIGVWPLFALTESELIAGRDNKHLDFRVSILKEAVGETGAVVFVSTICVVHNWFGKAYLFFVLPFHRWGLKMLIARARCLGRL